MHYANDLGYAAAKIRAPQGILYHPKPCVNLGAIVGNSTRILLVFSKPHFSKFSHLWFMCLVHKPENICF